MGHTHRHEPTPPVEDLRRGNLKTASIAFTEANEESFESDLYHYALHVPAEDWPACVLHEFGRRAGRGKPWRRHRDGEGIADHGAVPGTVEGAHRFYFTATREHEELIGTIVANSARAVERWLWDSERARGRASRDVRLVQGPPVTQAPGR